MSCSNRVPLSWTNCRSSRCASGSAALTHSGSEVRVVLSGDLSSWLTFAKNKLLDRTAASA